jgi:hypothetical protein
LNSYIIVELQSKKRFVNSLRPCAFEPALVDTSSNDVRVISVDICSPNSSSARDFFSADICKINARNFDSIRAILIAFESRNRVRGASKATTGSEISLRD